MPKRTQHTHGEMHISYSFADQGVQNVKRHVPTASCCTGVLYLDRAPASEMQALASNQRSIKTVSPSQLTLAGAYGPSEKAGMRLTREEIANCQQPTRPAPLLETSKTNALPCGCSALRAAPRPGSLAAGCLPTQRLRPHRHWRAAAAARQGCAAAAAPRLGCAAAAPRPQRRRRCR